MKMLTTLKTKILAIAAFAAVLVVGMAPALGAELSRAEFAEQLGKSVAHYGAAKGNGWCTATKIGPRAWLTAGHCIDFDTRLKTHDGTYLFPRSITLSVSEKSDGKRNEDWAILHVTTDSPTSPALTLACGEDIYQGQSVAYFGFPGGVKKGYFEGYISSVHTINSRGNDADYVIDIPVAGGASGSALVDRKTGAIIGVITEGVYTRRTGFFMAAAESAQNIDMCKDWNESIRDYGESEDPEWGTPGAKDVGEVGHT